MRDAEGARVLRSRMEKEIRAGRMLGGIGWSAAMVRRFFGGKNFWGIPCGATDKNGDPRGRITHDYGYYPSSSYSINAAHSSTSIKYISFKERTVKLSKMH